MTEVANAYGQALYDLASSENLAQQILDELSLLDDAFRAEPDFLRLLRADSLSKQERCQILDDSFRGRVHIYLLNFLKLLLEKGHIRHFSGCCAAYRQQYNLDNDILPVTAVTAVSLSNAQADKLREKLACLTGKAIDLTNRIDLSVLGGIRLDYDGKRLEDTVAHRLEAMRSALKNAGL